MELKFFFCISFLSVFLSFSQGDFILQSPVTTNYGVWGAWDSCGEGAFVKSMNLKFSTDGDGVPPRPPPNSDSPDDQDDQGLVQIELDCVTPDDLPGKKLVAPPGIQTHIPSNELMTCEGYAIGFQLMSSPSEIALDNTGANNFRLFCSGQKDGGTPYVEGFAEYSGEWTEPQLCKERQAVCGIRVQSSLNDTGAPDKTGINNVRLKCCDFPSPAQICEPTDRWELIQECDNERGKNPIECTFYRTVGIGVTMNFQETDGISLINEYEKYTGLGFVEKSTASTGDRTPYWLIHDLGKSFSVLQNSTVTGTDWTQNAGEVWNPEASTVVKFNVMEGFKTNIYQVVGSCSYFSVRTQRIKKVDTEREVAEVSM